MNSYGIDFNEDKHHTLDVNVRHNQHKCSEKWIIALVIDINLNEHTETWGLGGFPGNFR